MLLKVGAVQTLAELGEPERNLARIAHHVRDLADQGAQVIALPEAMNAGYLFDDAAHALGHGAPLDGEFVAGLIELADETGVVLGCGITEREADRLYNSAILLVPGDGVVATHRKLNLAPHDRRWFTRGDRPAAVADTQFGRIGLFICFDSRLPWVARNLALAGADLLVNCANFFSEDKAMLHLPVRAAENGVPILAASKAGRERAARYMGGSCAIDADGRTLELLGPDIEEGTLLTDLELQPGPRKMRLLTRRPQAYAILDEPFASTPGGKRALKPVSVPTTAVQVAAIQGSWSNANDLGRELDEVAALGAGIWVLPQHPCHARPTNADHALAIAVDTPALLERVAAATQRAKAWCVLGTVVEEAGAAIAVHAVTTPSGTVQLSRRVHLDPATAWSPTCEDWLLFDTGWGRVGVLGGADLAVPEAGRCLAALGAELICVTAAIDPSWIRDLAVLERSSETRCHVVLANRIDDCEAPGASAIVPLSGFPTPKLLAGARAPLDRPAVVAGFIELASARNKAITTETHLFEPGPPVLSAA